jgi:carbon-monoxide dehydrogenase large subunit
LRKEDPKFLTTGGRYIEDLNDEPLFAGALHVTYVRSSVAHAKITNIDLSDCKNSPGVVAVLRPKIWVSKKSLPVLTPQPSARI